jgi:hypothetical protein
MMSSPVRPNAKALNRLISLLRPFNIINAFLLQASVEKDSVSAGIRTPARADRDYWEIIADKLSKAGWS